MSLLETIKKITKCYLNNLLLSYFGNSFVVSNHFTRNLFKNLLTQTQGQHGYTRILVNLENLECFNNTLRLLYYANF